MWEEMRTVKEKNYDRKEKKLQRTMLQNAIS